MLGSTSKDDAFHNTVASLLASLDVAQNAYMVTETEESAVIRVSEIALCIAGLDRTKQLKKLRSIEAKLRRLTHKEVLVRLTHFDGCFAEIEDNVRQRIAETPPLNTYVTSIMMTAITLPLVDLVIELTSAAQHDIQRIKNLVHGVAQITLSASKIELRDVIVRDTTIGVPHHIALLNSLKVSQPADIDTLQGKLRDRGFHIESEKWLRHQLDVLRKGGYVMWSPVDQRYRLTFLGLHALPGSKNRNSSDVNRALALGKRRW